MILYKINLITRKLIDLLTYSIQSLVIYNRINVLDSGYYMKFGLLTAAKSPLDRTRRLVSTVQYSDAKAASG
jgi:hypothetical protein